MSRLFIGIDFSLNSVGVVFKQKENIKYLNILNRYAISANKTLSTEEVFADNEIIDSITRLEDVIIKPVVRYPVPKAKKIGLCEWERLHIGNCLMVGKIVYEAMKEITQDYMVSTNDIFICLENYSYGSDSDTTIQIVEATMKLKQLIFDDLMLCLDHFHIVAGPTLKMWVGKGDYDKYQMFEAYINNVKQDKMLDDDPLRKVLARNPGLYWVERKKKGKSYKEIKTPISDIIDAYFIALRLEREIGYGL